MNPILIEDIPFPADENPILEVIRLTMPFLDLENGPWVAGGVARLLSEGVNEIGNSDIDVFFPSEEMFNWTVGTMADHKSLVTHPKYDARPVAKHKYSVKYELTFNNKVYNFQFINKRFYENLPELFDDFDFTATMFATDGANLVAGVEAQRDNQSRILKLHRKPDKPKAARLAKYCAYGFTPGPGVVKDMMGIELPNFTPNEALTVDDY